MINCQRKVYWVGGEWWQTKFNVSPGPGLWALVLGPSGPDLGPDLDLTWDLDLSLTIIQTLLGLLVHDSLISSEKEADSSPGPMELQMNPRGEN